MDLLAGTDTGGDEGRWVMTPRKGVRFVGPRQRARARVRARRRRLLVALSEVTGLLFLIGVFPPLRGIWTAAMISGAITGAYVLLLMHLKSVESGERMHRATTGHSASERFRATAPQYVSGERYVAVSDSRMPRATYAGFAAIGESDDTVHVVIHDS